MKRTASDRHRSLSLPLGRHWGLSLRLSLLILSFSHFPIFTASAQTVRVASPDGRIGATLGQTEEGLTLRITDGDVLLTEVGLGIEAEVDGKSLAATRLRGKARTQPLSETITAPNYRQSRFTATCNFLRAPLDGGLTLEVRAYDEGVAFRYVLPTAKRPAESIVRTEATRFRFPKDYTAYLPHSTNPRKPDAMAFQAVYDVRPLSQQDTLLAFLPATVDCDGTKVTLMESDGEGYPGMFVSSHPSLLTSHFSHYPRTFAYYPWRVQKYVTETEPYIARGVAHTPWRIVGVAREDREMPMNNLVYALASPSRISDTSWIKPGRVAWDWWNDWGLSGVPFQAGINNATYKHYIDFAARYGLPYVILDEGWYNPKSGDMLTTVPDIDLPMLVQYARKRNVRLILWTVFNVLDDQLEEACRRYAEMGIAGFKVDFLDRNDQEAVQMTYRIAEACARHRLLLDYHGIYAPTGIQRTWPNVVNFEAVFGMEEAKWTKHDEQDMPLYDVTFPFVRGQAGYVDFTPGGMRNATRQDFQPVYSNPMTMGTRCHQLAHYIVHESPLTMLADNPTIYDKEEECTRFLASLPAMYESLTVVDGRMGEYIVVLRTDAQGNYYLGGETNWDARDLTLSLGFLPEGQTYQAQLFVDGANADRVATDYRVERMEVKKSSTLSLHLASGGGFAIRLTR